MRRRRGPIDRLDVLALVIGTGFATFIFSILVSTSITSSLINDKHKVGASSTTDEPRRATEATSAPAQGHGGPIIQEPAVSHAVGKAVAQRSPPTSGHRRYFSVTAYCPCELCCGEWADGITSSGVPAIGKLISAPQEFPFGTVMHIPGYGWATVQDRGGAIKGARLEVLFSTHEAALRWGRKDLMVTIEKGK